MTISHDFRDWAPLCALLTFLIPPALRWLDRRRKA